MSQGDGGSRLGWPAGWGVGAERGLWYDFTRPRAADSLRPATEEQGLDKAKGPAPKDLALYLGLSVTTLFFLASFIDITSSGPGVVLLGAVLLGTGVTTAFLRPRWLPAIAVAYFPFSMQFPFVLGGGINMVNLLLLLSIVAIVSHREQMRRRYSFELFEYLLVLLIAFGFWGMLQAYRDSGELVESITFYKRWVTPPLFFFVVRALLYDRADVARLVKIMAWTTTAAGLLTWWSAIERGPRSSIEAARVSGIFNGPNEMGTFLVYAAMPMFAVAVWKLRPTKRILYLAGFLIAARAMLFTFSRGAYVSLAGSVVVMLLLRNPLYLVGAATLGGGLVLIEPRLIPDSVIARLGQTTIETAGVGGGLDEANLDKSVSHRFVLWRAAGRMIRDNPVTGIGLGRYPYYVDAYAERELKENEARDVHNAYLLVASELGLPALLLMLSLLATLVLRSLGLYLRRRHLFDRMLGLAVLGSVTALSATFMLGSRFADENFIGYFWTLAAMLVVVARFPDEKAGAERPVVTRAHGV